MRMSQSNRSGFETKLSRMNCGASETSQSNRSGFETKISLNAMAASCPSQSNRSGFETGTTAAGRTPTRRSQSNRSGFETVLRHVDCVCHRRLNPTVVVLKPPIPDGAAIQAGGLNPTVVVLKQCRESGQRLAFPLVSIQP